MGKKTRRDKILDCVSDCVFDLVYHDRKEDEDLPRGAIEDAVEAKEIAVEEIWTAFKEELEEHFEEYFE